MTVIGIVWLLLVAMVPLSLHAAAEPPRRTMVIAWGANTYGQTNVPADLTNVVALEAGEYFSMALRADGTVALWGDNDHCQSTVPPDATNVVLMAAGSIYDLVQTKDGRLMAWGADFGGVTNVPADDATDVIAIDGGAFHALALTAGGRVISWGYSAGNFGNATNVPSDLSNVVAISGGGYHNLALKADGTVASWGFNSLGQTNVPTGLSNVLAISAGGFHSLALKADGTVVGWGGGAPSITNAPPSLSNVVAISAGEHHSLALKADGTLVTWGANIYVPPALSNVIAISAGGFHNLALIGDGSPAITLQPLNQSVTAGQSARFHATGVGAPPLAYQWQMNGTNLPGATTPMLALQDIQIEQAGDYSLVLSNALGTTSSRPARLVVTPVSLERPRLSIRQNRPAGLDVEWLASNGFRLETTDELEAPNWRAVLTVPVTSNGTSRVTLELTNRTQFFRLRRN